MQRLAPAFLLVLWLMAWHRGTQATSRVPSFGVKLCGREFIRAVIFTCGGSRWRRSEALQTEEPAEIFGSLVQSDVESEEEDLFSEWPNNLRPSHHNDIMDYGSPQGWRDPSGGRRAAATVAEDALRGVEREGGGVGVV